MYRINRIGPQVITDVDDPIIVSALANFNAHDHAIYSYGCFVMKATTQPMINFANFVFNGVPTLASVMSAGIGIAVNGDFTPPKHSYTVQAVIDLSAPAVSAIKVELVIGRLAAAASTAASVVVPSPTIIPCNVHYGGDRIHAEAVKTVVTQDGVIGAVPPATAWDVVAFWHISNVSGGAVALNLLSGHIGLHKYTEDLMTFDPNR